MIKKFTSEVNQKMIVWGLFFGILLLSGLYAFFVYQMTFFAAERETLTEKFVSLDLQIADLQSEHLALSNMLTADLALSLGYKETRPKFITRQSVGALAKADNFQ